MNTTKYVTKTERIERAMELHHRASMQWTNVEEMRTSHRRGGNGFRGDTGPTWPQVLAAIDVGHEYDRDLRDFLAVNL